jgi:hypothetical protein
LRLLWQPSLFKPPPCALAGRHVAHNKTITRDVAMGYLVVIADMLISVRSGSNAMFIALAQ